MFHERGRRALRQARHGERAIGRFYHKKPYTLRKGFARLKYVDLSHKKLEGILRRGAKNPSGDPQAGVLMNQLFGSPPASPNNITYINQHQRPSPYDVLFIQPGQDNPLTKRVGEETTTSFVLDDLLFNVPADEVDQPR